MAATFYTGVGISDAFDTNAGQPGAAPLGAQMQGNPNPSQEVIPAVNVEPPLPQNSSAQLTATQLSSGNIPHNLQPTNVAQGSGPVAGNPSNAGGDSLLAQMARGQVILADSTYGQGGFIAPNGGSSPQAVQPAQSITQPSTARLASGVTFSNNGNYSGM